MNRPTQLGPVAKLGPVVKLGPVAVVSALAQLSGWQLTGDGPSIAIEKTYTFASYRETIFFINAVAYIAEQLGHHPDLSVHYSRCVVRLCTHDAAGLTRADFDSATRIDALIAVPVAAPGTTPVVAPVAAPVAPSGPTA